MKASYINPLISSFANVLESLAKITPEKGALVKKETIETTKDLTLIFLIEGELNGYFTFGFTKETAMKIVETMTSGMGGTGELDELGISCIIEMAGITRGKMGKELTDLDLTCNVNEAKLIYQEEFPSFSKEETLEFNLETTIGPIELNISLHRKNLT